MAHTGRLSRWAATRRGLLRCPQAGPQGPAAGHPLHQQTPAWRGDPPSLGLLSSIQNHCCHELLPSSEKPTLITCGRLMRQADPCSVLITQEPSSEFPDSVSEGDENPAPVFPDRPALPAPHSGVHAASQGSPPNPSPAHTCTVTMRGPIGLPPESKGPRALHTAPHRRHTQHGVHSYSAV